MRNLMAIRPPRFSRFYAGRIVAASAILLTFTPFLFTVTTATAASSARTFASFAIATTWERTDRPIDTGLAQSSRSWVWGNSIQIASEPYVQGYGGQRLVQYFDKGRLEQTNPAQASTVTSGLLVREMLSGEIQIGDNNFTSKAVPNIPIAGDQIISNTSPTYQTFVTLASLNNDHPAPNQIGGLVTQYLDKSGKISTLTQLPAQVKFVQFDANLQHNIPDVFWNFLQQRGVIWQNNGYVYNQPLFNWLQVVGLPLTEPYWTTALVNGQSKSVMVQAFERRVLTFTPDNPTAFTVEMGNVGQHYYAWRYDGGSAPPPSDVTVPVPSSGKVVLANFPTFAQQHSLSCEYASTRIMTAYWGHQISEAQFIAAIPVNPDPHVGYRGNIDGPFGGTVDYGIYPEPIVKVLEQNGFKAKLLAGGAASLRQELQQGRPVQVWIIAGFGYSNPFKISYDNLNFTLAAGEHSVVVYGYDNNGVYISDPAYGGYNYISWPTFMRNWDYFNDMAISLWPADVTEPEGPDWGISPYFYRYWLNNNGLALFGLPLASAQINGNKVTQYFERARLEYDLNGPYNQPIVLGAIGRELTAGRTQEKPFQPMPNAGDNPSAVYFPQTQHFLTGGFRTFWEQNGGVAIFGYPISEEFTENGLTVQYFERARFEYHPDQPIGAQVTLGRIGAELLNKK